MIRRVAASLSLALACGLIVAPPAMADDSGGGGGASNIVIVQNHDVGAWRTRARGTVAHDAGPDAGNPNIAYAYAQCQDCRTVAVAVEVVLLAGPVQNFHPTNAAVAVNDQCVRCQTFAYARQVFLAPDHEVVLSDQARQQVDQLDAQLDAVAASNEAFDQMTTDLDGLTQQLVDVVQQDALRAGATTRGDDHREVDERDA